MDTGNLKELRALIALCRKTGVQSIKMDGIELVLSDYVAAPVAKRSRKKKTNSAGSPLSPESDEIADKILSDSLTPEQLLEWSVNSDPFTPGESNNQ